MLKSDPIDALLRHENEFRVIGCASDQTFVGHVIKSYFADFDAARLSISEGAANVADELGAFGHFTLGQKFDTRRVSIFFLNEGTRIELAAEGRNQTRKFRDVYLGYGCRRIFLS